MRDGRVAQSSDILSFFFIFGCSIHAIKKTRIPTTRLLALKPQPSTPSANSGKNIIIERNSPETLPATLLPRCKHCWQLPAICFLGTCEHKSLHVEIHRILFYVNIILLVAFCFSLRNMPARPSHVGIYRIRSKKQLHGQSLCIF